MRGIELPAVMGIVNVTPDSFSDGGQFLDAGRATEHGLELAAAGAAVLDVGGESTRPGSQPVPAGEQRRRVVPVIRRLVAETGVPVSVDTADADVAAAALEAGAAIVNDVTAGRDPRMFPIVRDAGAGMVLMHMLGEPKTMQQDPRYDDVVAEVRAFLNQRIEAATASGIERDRVVVDPGLGFGKTLDHNLTLMRHIDVLSELGRPVLTGPSRKSFVGLVTETDVEERLPGTAGAVAWLAANGSHVVRVHDVPEMVRVVRMIDAIRRAPER
jgi:dihydropteroate synthase